MNETPTGDPPQHHTLVPPNYWTQNPQHPYEGPYYNYNDPLFNPPKVFSVIEHDDLKPEINNFLWSILPDNTTLKEAEEVACSIYEMVLKLREKYETNSSNLQE